MPTTETLKEELEQARLERLIAEENLARLKAEKELRKLEEGRKDWLHIPEQREQPFRF